MHRTPEPLPGALLKQMGKLMAAGMGQQVQGAQLPAKVTPFPDLPPGQPAAGRVRLVLGGNHANPIGNQVLPVTGIKAVVGRLARTHAAMQETARAAFPDPLLGGLPETVPGHGTHQFAKANGGFGG